MRLSKVHRLICISNDKLVCNLQDNRMDFILACFLELSTMYRTMETRNYATAEAAIEHVKNKY